MDKYPAVSMLTSSRNSTFQYKGQNVNTKQVGHELWVLYILEGSIRKAGDLVRITTQLIEAFSGSHIWAGRYHGNLDDVFALQDEST